MLVPRRCLLAATMIAALACSKTPEAPHGSPVLLEVLWDLDGVPALVWSRDAAASVVATVPPRAGLVDFVFDRRLDGGRVEDTVNGMEAPKANPPVTVGWPAMDTVMSDPPFGADVFYNSISNFGPGTSYVFLRPRLAGFPAATTVTFTLDPNGLTSVYGEPMDGPTTITVNTGAFTVSLPNATAPEATSYRVPIAFSTRAPQAAALTPFIHVLAGVVPLPFELKNDNGDSTLLYIIPASGCGAWPPSTEITIFADEGLPDAFGRPLAKPVAGRFTTSSIGGCGGSDAGASGGDGGGSDGGSSDGGPIDAAPTDGAAPDDAPQSN